MSDQYAPEPAGDTQPAYHEAMADIAARSQKLVADFLARQAQNGTMTSVDPLNIGEAFLETMSRMMADPGRLVEAQFSLWQDYLTLCQTTGRRLMGQDVDPVARPAPGDRRFRHQDWDRNEVFNFIKQSYLLTAGWVQQTVGKVEGLDDKTARKVDFYTRQFTDALSPSNFVLTNPEVLRATLDSGGDNLVRGLQNLLEDLETGDGRLNVKMADEAHFEVGGDLAVTPGKVVYRNALMELVQYSPTTETVYRAPLLIIPPWINKFYILDLRPKNSLIKWAVDQGHTVFVISWVNPDSELSRKSFDDYLREGPLEAIAATEKATGERRINLAYPVNAHDRYM